MQNRQWDAVKLESLNIPYNVTELALNNEPHLVNGSLNTYVGFDGSLSTRNGLAASNSTCSSGRIDRLWYYETLLPLTATGKIGQFVLASVYKTSTSRWSLFYAKVGLTSGTSSNFTEVTSLGEIRESTAPHEVVIVRGKAYVKMFPRTSASDKLGLYTWEMPVGGTQQVGYWGLLGPTIPAKVDGKGRRSYGSITSASTSVVVTSTTIGGSLPSTPFTAVMDLEQVTVTAIATSTPGAGYDTLTITRGVNGTTATAHDDGTIILYRAFSASNHNVSAAYGWAYSYCWKNKNGQYSNRAPLQTNLDDLPSKTGPITRLIPKITITCPTDTTEYPSILILRTTDGGGIFYPLTEIDNPGTSTASFEDKYFPTGSTAVSNAVIYDGPIYSRISGITFADPVEDEFLVGDQRGPDLDTNSPLPGVNLPKEIGTDTPLSSTSLAYFKNRIWVGVDNILWFTSFEELPYGIPEESCDTSSSGGFFRFQENISQIYATKDMLLIFTRKGRVLKLTGALKETFEVNQIGSGTGFAREHPAAICSAEDKIFYLSKDYHIYMMDENSERIISHPLGDSIATAATAGYKIHLSYYTANNTLLKTNWLVLGLYNQSDQTLSRTYIYDLYKSQRLNRNYSDNIERSAQDLPEKTYDFWNAPWTIPAVCQISCPANDDNENGRNTMWFVTYSGGTSSIRPYEITPINLSNDGDLANVDWNFVANFNLFQNPPGNHINTMRAPGLHPNLYALYIERLVYPVDIDPDLGIYKDSLWQKSLPATQGPDQFLQNNEGYKTIWGTFNEVGKYFAPTIRMNRPRKPVNIQKLALVYDPEGGV